MNSISLIQEIPDSEKWKKYMNSDRKGIGSQRESSSIELGCGYCLFNGYQKFILTHSSVKPQTQNVKYRELRNCLKRIKLNGKTVADIGANNGVVSYISRSEGALKVFALDHDKECIDNMERVNAHLLIPNVNPTMFSFGDKLCGMKFDVVIAMAIVHWVYSCTSNFGCLTKIVSYLKNLTKSHLIIEWVTPNDGAIREFKHISFNKEVHNSPYTTESFEKAIQINGGRIVEILSTGRKTRIIYVIQF